MEKQVQELMECPICYELMSDERHKPMVLIPCGHSICECCMKAVFKKQGNKSEQKCPTCNKNCSSFTINYTAQNLIQSLCKYFQNNSNEDINAKPAPEPRHFTSQLTEKERQAIYEKNRFTPDQILKISMIKDMGYDEKRVVEGLQLKKWDVETTVNYLLQGPESPVVDEVPIRADDGDNDEKLAKLMNMGFPRDKSNEALEISNGDVSHAVNYLISNS